jgi:membrane protease YdiL (CAAX protease family)
LEQYNAGQNNREPDGINRGQDEMQQKELPADGMNPKKIVSRAGFALFVLAIVVLGVQTLIEILVSTFKPELADTDWYVWAVTAVSMVVTGFPVYFLVIRGIPDSPKGKVVRLKPSGFFVIFFICTAAMYITNFISVLITFAIALVKGEELINPAAEAILGGNYVITLLYAAVAGPIFEELIFRKLLLDKLRRFGDVPAILMTGIAFGLFHLNLSQFFYATVLGFIFAYVVIRTNTVIYSIILHMMINFISTAITPLVTTQNIVGIMLVGMWVLVSITIGAVFFILSIKKIRLEKQATMMKGSDYFLNTGTVLYTLVCLVMIVIITIS